MPIGGKDAFLSKVTFRRESNWYSKTKQMLKDMKTISEINAIAPYQPNEFQQGYGIWQAGYIEGQKNGAAEQKVIDDKRYEEYLAYMNKQLTDSLASQREHIIAKACEWIETHNGDDSVIEEFLKYMGN